MHEAALLAEVGQRSIACMAQRRDLHPPVQKVKSCAFHTGWFKAERGQPRQREAALLAEVGQHSIACGLLGPAGLRQGVAQLTFL